MNADRDEIKKFDQVADIWWDPNGEMGSLHVINPLRMRFIQEKVDLKTSKILDVGCGGGILAETLAEAGGNVSAIDLSQLSLQAAAEHARQKGLTIRYVYESVEESASKYPGEFDVVTCMEMLEHVPVPQTIVAACAKALKPGGHFFCSTINRTLKAWLFAIIGGEYILHLLPRGSHQYAKLIKPADLKKWAKEDGLVLEALASLKYDPLRRKFSVIEGKTDVNYLMHFIKRSV